MGISRGWGDILIVAAPIVGFGVAGHVVGGGTLPGGALINAGYVVMALVGAAVLRKRGSNWSELGLKPPRHWLKTVGLGVSAFAGAVVVFVIAQAAALGLLGVLGTDPSELDQSRFLTIEGNVPLFLLMLVLAWTTIAFGEELFYRAFLITRMVEMMGISRFMSVWLAGAVFGIAHFGEGPVGVLANGALGVLFGWIYLRSSQNLWITIIAHGMLNTLRFTLLFIGAA